MFTAPLDTRVFAENVFCEFVRTEPEYVHTWVHVVVVRECEHGARFIKHNRVGMREGGVELCLQVVP